MPDLPTIAHDRAMGLSRCKVICASPGCGHVGVVTYDRIGLSQETIIIEIPQHRRFVCSICGGRTVTIEGHWLEYRPNGSGRKF